MTPDEAPPAAVVLNLHGGGGRPEAKRAKVAQTPPFILQVTVDGVYVGALPMHRSQAASFLEWLRAHDLPHTTSGVEPYATEEVHGDHSSPAEGTGAM